MGVTFKLCHRLTTILGLAAAKSRWRRFPSPAAACRRRRSTAQRSMARQPLALGEASSGRGLVRGRQIESPAVAVTACCRPPAETVFPTAAAGAAPDGRGVVAVLEISGECTIRAPEKEEGRRTRQHRGD